MKTRVWVLRRAPGSGPEGAGAIPPKQHRYVHRGLGVVNSVMIPPLVHQRRPSTLYQTLGLKATMGCPEELNVPRATLHHLLAARSGHGDFAEYHERFGHDAPLLCTCGRKKHPTHPFYCRKVARRDRFRMEPNARGFVTDALGPKNFWTYIKLIQGTRFFEEICPRNTTWSPLEATISQSL